jgi:hypothetical protein
MINTLSKPLETKADEDRKVIKKRRVSVGVRSMHQTTCGVSDHEVEITLASR